MFSVILIMPLIGLQITCVSQETNPKLTPLLEGIENGLKRRNITAFFEEMEAFFNKRLDACAGNKRFSDKTGNCRLAWVDYLLRHPRKSINEAEIFTRQIYELANTRDRGIGPLIEQMFSKLETVNSISNAIPTENTNKNVRTIGTNLLGCILDEAQQAFEESLKPLNKKEIKELYAELYHQTTDNDWPATGTADEKKGRRVFDLLEKIDRFALYRAARTISEITDQHFIDGLVKNTVNNSSIPKGVEGNITGTITTKTGAIVFGGTNSNVYKLDEMVNICAVVDLGGNDRYFEGTLSENRPVLIIIDLSGNDVYLGTRPGIQGGALLGISALIDCAGDDTYEANDLAQGSCLGGVGILIDMTGNDSYKGKRRVQGQAISGVGLLLDCGGSDKYRGALLAQGVGGPLGFGLLADIGGNDHYYAGGLYPCPYDDSPGHGGFSQGVGIGPRGVANGGIGMLLDGWGDDVYEADYFSTAGAYWFSAGFLRDFAGNDQRIGSTRTAFDGSERKPARFLRWGVGYSCHYATAFLFDDNGDDVYIADFAGVAFAWDIGAAVICDFEGNDKYVSPGHGAASASNAGLAVLYDAAGNDVYEGSPPATVKQKTDYHPEEKTGGNFAFLIDGGGDDKYPDNLEDGKEYERGWAGGFLIDK